MQFSDTSSAQNGLIQSCEFWSGLGKAQISGNTQRLAEFTRLINNRYDQYTMLLLSSQDGWDFDDINHTDYPIITADLVADQQNYSLPASLDLIKIKRVEVKLDGNKFYRAEPIDINEISSGTDADTIAGKFSTVNPFYDAEYDVVRLYPIPTQAVTNGLKITYYRNVDAFTTADTTQKPGFDRAFHELLSIGAVLDWSIAKGKDVKGDLQGRLAQLEGLFIDHYGRKNRDRQIILKPFLTNADYS